MKTIVMTGGTTGFGRLAVHEMGRSPEHRLILGGRPLPGRDPAQLPYGGDLLELDLAHLESVRSFAADVSARADTVDGLVLNAGIIRPDADTRTADGFETTFAVNHLAHYLLLRLLLPALAPGATVVLTTSGTHDPATGAGLATPRHADARLLAHPDRDPERHSRPTAAGEHAYTASKLCAVLTARSLTAHPDARSRRLTVVAYDPGQVFGTGLVQDLALPLRIGWTLLGTPLLGWPMRRFNRNLNTRAAAGHALANLALGRTTPPSSPGYAALRRGGLSWPNPSDLARDDALAQQLWTDSASLVVL
ncbi:SDR family NAD(P)-dependent oxidoreductase [Kribbella catacumbae]|uniref:SDR family NAD(P)-dependent oxidoreductase n=1 Tax=Kribbella catacumbae TaxID=460086 RepID=UPI00037C4245|nr:SDR family NAD(P)-dependent oxidoreductase [Kribbella catacumbae]